MEFDPTQKAKILEATQQAVGLAELFMLPKEMMALDNYERFRNGILAELIAKNGGSITNAIEDEASRLADEQDPDGKKALYKYTDLIQPGLFIQEGK